VPGWVSLENENIVNTLLFICVAAALVALAPPLLPLDVRGMLVAVYTPVGRVLLSPVVVDVLLCALVEPDVDIFVEELAAGALVIMLMGAVPGTPATVTRLGSGACQSDFSS